MRLHVVNAVFCFGAQGATPRVGEWCNAYGRLQEIIGSTLAPYSPHLAAIGHPNIGDALYGEEAERLLLHASALNFIHPASGETLALASEPPF